MKFVCVCACVCVLQDRHYIVLSHVASLLFLFWGYRNENMARDILHTKVVLTPNRFWLGINWINVTDYWIEATCVIL